jgi:hypothetical protein
MAEDIWGRLFIIVGLACMVWSQFAHDAAWIAGAFSIIVGLLVIPAPKERSDD